MGRKGIGKLAGFGLAHRMKVDTWRDGSYTTVTLDVDLLKTPAGDVRTLTLPGSVRTIPNADDHGTGITLSNLKHASALDPELLRHNLARRFSRSVRGRMSILVNGVAIDDAPVTELFRATVRLLAVAGRVSGRSETRRMAVGT